VAKALTNSDTWPFGYKDTRIPRYSDRNGPVGCRWPRYKLALGGDASVTRIFIVNKIIINEKNYYFWRKILLNFTF